MENLQKQKNIRRERRRNKVSKQVKSVSSRVRLTIFKSLRHIYAQIIDDNQGRTLVAASDMEKSIIAKKLSDKKELAAAVGTLIAEKAKKANITKVAFDRGASRYHGRVKSFADAARSSGLEF